MGKILHARLLSPDDLRSDLEESEDK
jgi:hypothetical protein